MNKPESTPADAMNRSHIGVEELIDDRRAEGIFRVHRSAFLDPGIFELEMSKVFESTWVFIGLESQVARPHDFITSHIGRQPIILTRTAGGTLGCFLNSCRHRGMLLCPFSGGNQKFHVCRYHGWVYDSSGRNVGITDQQEGQYPDSFASGDHDLVPVARLESYRGFVFASLSPNVPGLREHLGGAHVFLDIVADQAPNGLEYVAGAIDYTFDANWKLQFENGLDFYHFASTHSSYVDILNRRIQPSATPGPTSSAVKQESALTGQGTFSFPRGHSVMWSTLRPGQAQHAAGDVGDAPSPAAEGDEGVRRKWRMRQRNLTIFPNLQIIDIQSMKLSLQLRTWQPLAVDKTRISSHCLAPVGEARGERRSRIRAYEDFFNPSGLATSDDNVMYEFCQSGFRAIAAGPTQGYLRGLGELQTNGMEHAAELNIDDCESAFGSMTFGNETCFHAGYREWQRLLLAEDSRSSVIVHSPRAAGQATAVERPVVDDAVATGLRKSP